jgi:hypothetical protein
MNSSAITYPKGKYNPAGISTVYYCYPEDIATFPTLADPLTATTYTSLVQYADDITMKTGKQFFPLYCTLETGQLKNVIQGPRDGKGYEISMAISFPGNDPNFLGFKAYNANRDQIFIVREKNGVLRVVGDLDNTCTLDSDDEDSGQKIADGRKTILTFKTSLGTPAPIYTGDLSALLTPAA